MKTNTLILLFLLVGHLGFAAPTPDGPYIYTIGVATLSAKADQVVIPFKIIERNDDAVKALAVLKEKTERVFAVLTEEQIGRSDVEAHRIDLHQEVDREKSSRVVGFRATRDFRITLRDLQRFTALLDKLTQIPGAELGAGNFGHSDADELNARCNDLAIDHARKQAERMAARAGAKVHRVHAISPESVGHVDDVVTRRYYESSRPFVQMPMPPPLSSAEFIVPDFTVRASLHVVFTLAYE